MFLTFDEKPLFRIFHRVVVIPSAYVNNVPIRGALTAANIFTAICAGFADGTEPVVCQQCTRCPSPIDCVETGFCTNTWEHHIINHLANKTDDDGISSTAFYMTVVVCMGGIVAMGVWYHNRSNVQMREQMRNLLAQYMPLDDDDQGGMNPMDFNQHSTATNPLLLDMNNNNIEGQYRPSDETNQSLI